MRLWCPGEQDGMPVRRNMHDADGLTLAYHLIHVLLSG